MNTKTVAALSGISVYSVIVIVALALVFWRRNRQPFKFRAPILLIISGGAGCVHSACAVVYEIQNPDTIGVYCDLWRWVVWITYPGIVLPYVLRCYRVYKIFGANQYISNPRYWDSHVIREQLLVNVLIMAMVAILIIKVLVDLFFSRLDSETGYTCVGFVPSFWIVLNVLEIGALIFVIMKLRHSPIADGHGVVHELAGVCVVWTVAAAIIACSLVVTAGYIPTGFYPDPSHGLIAPEAYLQVQVCVLVARNLFIFVVSLVHPLMQSFVRPDYDVLWSHSDALCSLDSVLQNICCLQYFRDFLSHKGDSELLQCWVEIALFMDLPEADRTVKAQAMRIFDKYIHEDSQHPVKVEEDTREQTYARLSGIGGGLGAVRPPSQTFDLVQHELYTMLERQFPLFLASDACRACLLDLEREENVKTLLERSDML